MTAYIKHTKPTLLQTLLNLLGLIDLHTKVNCWFCNQDSYILPGTKNTVERWYCHLCENTNQRDENGEIMDPKLLEVEHPSNKSLAAAAAQLPPRSASEPLLSRSISSSKGRSLCQDCQNTQTWIYERLSEYIPDESDPLYEERLATADDYKARLYQTHGLCDPCQHLIDTVVKEQREALRFRMIHRQMADFKAVTESLKIPTKSTYYSKAFLWYFIHSFTVLFVLYCSLIPPQGGILDWASNLDYTKLIESVQEFWIEKDWILVIGYIFTSLLNNLKSYWNVVYCITGRGDSDVCAWDINDQLLSILSFNIISLFSFRWHPKIKRWINSARAKNLSVYKKLQYTLLAYRLFLVFLVTQTTDIRVIMSFSVGYITLALISIEIVKLPEAVLREKSKFIESTGDDNQAQEEIEDVEMTDVTDFSVSEQEPTPSYIPTPPLSESIPSTQGDPMEIDYIANGINNIRV